MPIVVALIVALLGAALEGEFGFLVGGLAGYAAAATVRLGRRMTDLERRQGAAAVAGAAEPGAAMPTEPVATASAPAPAAPADRPPPRPEPEPPPASEPAAPPEPAALDVLVDRARDLVVRFFTTGNLVVRVGVVVLFFGVAFLLRYAYEHALLPVELRLAGAGLGGIVLTALGWRLRGRSDTYGLVLQGAGVGLMYLTLFAAARLYGLLPAPVAFAGLVVLVAASSLLAVLQNSQALAIFSMSGGFLAPVLVSTGTGSHVALFSYYALLNTGILAMAWFRFWRWLNWTGFVFTFAIGALWGYRFYQPHYFATTEPFLILFFLYYVGVSVLFARRQPVDLKGVVDGTLVFGTPIVSFALQAALVREIEFGLAYSALAAAVVYVAIALWLKRQGAFATLLGQSFVALSVVFATLAIPFAFDNQRWTAAAWAVEGAGLIWVGLRQAQLLPRLFGMLLQLAAAVAFLAELGTPVDDRIFLNGAFLGTALLGLAGGFSAWVLSGSDPAPARFERPLRWLFLGWGVLWWLAGGLRELSGFEAPWLPAGTWNNVAEHLMLLYLSASVAALLPLARWLRWTEGRAPGFLLVPVAALVLTGLDVGWERQTALADLGWLAWPALFATVLWHLRLGGIWPRATAVWHAAWWWLATAFLAYQAAALAAGGLDEPMWRTLPWGAVPLVVAAGLLRLRRSTRWPLATHRESYFGLGYSALLGYLVIWLLAAGTTPGDPAPLPYLVLANPLELTQIGVLLVLVLWSRNLEATRFAGLSREVLAAVGIIAFATLNLVAARAVHLYAGVPFPLPNVLASDAFQTTASILWTATSLVLMGIAARRTRRVLWLVGATLLALVILKLFTLDLAKLEVVARIVSFISVGVLMLVIGYLAPLPPARAEPQSS